MSQPAAAPSVSDAATSYGLAGTVTPSITHATTSYGQVIEYIQSKFHLLLCWRRLKYERCLFLLILLTRSQIESTSPHIRILLTSTHHSHILQYRQLLLRKSLPNQHPAQSQCHPGPGCILPYISPLMMIYSIIASMQTSGHCISVISIDSASFYMRFSGTQITKVEGSYCGASRIREVEPMPLAY